MPDMICNLLTVPDPQPEIQRLADEGIIIRRIATYEASYLREFVTEKFSRYWADEVMAAFSHQPTTCFIATHERKIVGFGAYECTCRDFFGPTGVDPEFRNRGIGKVLLLVCLKAMREHGYAYGVIGGAGPVEFYEKCVGAVKIAVSPPSIYQDILGRKPA